MEPDARQTRALTRGDFVWLTGNDGRSVRAMVTLASPNGASLIVMFDGMVDGCVGMMPLIGLVRVGADGAVAGWDYRNLMTQRPVSVCTDYRPDHNGECLNCDEPFDGHPGV